MQTDPRSELRNRIEKYAADHKSQALGLVMMTRPTNAGVVDATPRTLDSAVVG